MNGDCGQSSPFSYFQDRKKIMFLAIDKDLLRSVQITFRFVGQCLHTMYAIYAIMITEVSPPKGY